jgi:hypothetical protein
MSCWALPEYNAVKLGSGMMMNGTTNSEKTASVVCDEGANLVKQNGGGLFFKSLPHFFREIREQRIVIRGKNHQIMKTLNQLFLGRFIYQSLADLVI